MGALGDELLSAALALDERLKRRETAAGRQEIACARTKLLDAFARVSRATRSLSRMRQQQTGERFDQWRSKYGEDIFSLLELTWDLLRKRAGKPRAHWFERSEQLKELRALATAAVAEVPKRPVPLLNDVELEELCKLFLDVQRFTIAKERPITLVR